MQNCEQAEIVSLRERLHILTTDSTAASTEISDLHRQLEENKTTFEKERKALEDEIANARADDSRAQAAQLAAQLDLRRQAQFARDSHDKYERELLAHAEDVKRLTETKEELKRVRAKTSELTNVAEVATANLAGSEASWGRQKSALEQEISDFRKRFVFSLIILSIIVPDRILSTRLGVMISTHRMLSFTSISKPSVLKLRRFRVTLLLRTTLPPVLLLIRSVTRVSPPSNCVKSFAT